MTRGFACLQHCLLMGLIAASVGADRLAVNESAATNPITWLNTMLKSELPIINQEVKSNIPESYGDCSTRHPMAPKPCSGNKNIYYHKKNWEYNIEARWVTGLKSVDFTEIVASPLSGGFKGLTLNIQGFFGQLPLSLYIGECATFNICSHLWDNTNACCGTNKGFDVSVSAVCSSDPSKPIDRLEVSKVDLEKIEVTEKIVGIKVNLKDLTKTVEKEVKSLLVKHLIDAKIVKVDDKKVTLKDFLNNPNSKQVHVAGYFCGFASASASASTYADVASSLVV